MARGAESQLHKTIADLLNAALLPPAIWTTFPAGWGKLPKGTAGRLHASGLKAGFPDILIFHDGRCIGIELKVPAGRLSAIQQSMFHALANAGVRVYVARSAEDVLVILREAKLPVRNLEIAA